MIEKFQWLFQNLLNLIGGLIIAAIAYLMEIKGTFHIMWIVMVIDLFIGILKSKIVTRQPFQMRKFLLWLLFVFISTAVVALVFATEKELGGVEPVSYKGFIILIVGFVISSILRNTEKLTNQYIFTVLLDFINKAVKKVTNVDLKKYEKD